jgi:bifunctional non-homologous end joining protein LigD
LPAIFSASISKKQRHNRIFLDYLRNEKEATAIAPFLPCHDTNASLAVPVNWKKLPSLKSAKEYNLKTIDEYFSLPYESLFTFQ